MLSTSSSGIAALWPPKWNTTSTRWSSDSRMRPFSNQSARNLCLRAADLDQINPSRGLTLARFAMRLRELCGISSRSGRVGCDPWCILRNQPSSRRLHRSGFRAVLRNEPSLLRPVASLRALFQPFRLTRRNEATSSFFLQLETQFRKKVLPHHRANSKTGTKGRFATTHRDC